MNIDEPEMIPRADADLAVALMVEKAAREADDRYARGEMGNPGHHIRALAPASTLAELQALRDDVTGWISNARVAREKWSEYEDRAEAAEAELATLRAQVDRLAGALLTIRDDRMQCPRAVDCVQIARAALTEGAAP